MILEFARKIASKGGKLYLVGGALRDELLHKQVEDKDYCVTGLDKQEFLELFPDSHQRGKSFEVFVIENCEFALARTEEKIGIGHKEFKTTTHKNITIQEDLKRRDLTINAMAKEIVTEELLDPFGGKKDLENKVLRATSEAFLEDPLRTYRTARFASTLVFSIEEQTLEFMKKSKEELKALSKERVFTEFKKALQSEKPSLFLEALRNAEVLEVHFKEIADLIGSLQPIQYHPEGDSYKHTLLVVDETARLTNDLETRFSGLVHDLGKGVTPKEMYPHHYGHDEKGINVVKNLCYRLGIPNSWKKCGQAACKYHMKGGIFAKMTPAKKVTFIEEVSKTILGLDKLQIVVMADKCSSRPCEEEKISFANIGKEMLQEVTGNLVKQKYNIESGKVFGEKLHQERVEWMTKKEKCDKVKSKETK